MKPSFQWICVPCSLSPSICIRNHLRILGGVRRVMVKELVIAVRLWMSWGSVICFSQMETGHVEIFLVKRLTASLLACLLSVFSKVYELGGDILGVFLKEKIVWSFSHLRSNSAVLKVIFLSNGWKLAESEVGLKGCVLGDISHWKSCICKKSPDAICFPLWKLICD